MSSGGRGIGEAEGIDAAAAIGGGAETGGAGERGNDMGEEDGAVDIDEALARAAAAIHRAKTELENPDVGEQKEDIEANVCRSGHRYAGLKNISMVVYAVCLALAIAACALFVWRKNMELERKMADLGIVETKIRSEMKKELSRNEKRMADIERELETLKSSKMERRKFFGIM